MKRIVFLTCIGSVALALTAWGAPKDKPTTRSAKGKSAPSAHTVSARGGDHVASHAAPVRTSRSFSAARSHQRAIAAPRTRSSSVARARAVRSSRVETARVRNTRTANARTTVAARNRTAINRERTLARANTSRINRTEAARLSSARAANANARIATRNNVAINRARNARVVNNWRSDRFRSSNYAAFYNYNRRWHDRSWWRNHYTRIIFVSGGWWYWNTGYWYPAWGYDPYAYYPYDGPIYGYGDLTPDQVIVNVQTQLQSDGYYAGSIDGILGSQTREAIAAFQADHGLAVTSAVDRPTLQTLGLA
jgi:Putative peptidoglycan binding domain